MNHHANHTKVTFIGLAICILTVLPLLAVREVRTLVHANEIAAFLIGLGGMLLAFVGAVLTCAQGWQRGLVSFLTSAALIGSLYALQYGTAAALTHLSTLWLVLIGLTLAFSGGLSLLIIGIRKESVT